jgi:hypothetical protein
MFHPSTPLLSFTSAAYHLNVAMTQQDGHLSLAQGNSFHVTPSALVGEPCSDPSSPKYYEALSGRCEHLFADPLFLRAYDSPDVLVITGYVKKRLLVRYIRGALLPHEGCSLHCCHKFTTHFARSPLTQLLNVSYIPPHL